MVNDFFDSGNGEIYKTVIEKRLHSTQSYYNYVNIKMDKIQPLSDYFGELIVRMMLREYDRILKDSMVNKRADCEMKLSNWLDDVLKSIENGDFEGKTKGERHKILIDSLHTFLNII